MTLRAPPAKVSSGVLHHHSRHVDEHVFEHPVRLAQQPRRLESGEWGRRPSRARKRMSSGGTRKVRVRTARATYTQHMHMNDVLLVSAAINLPARRACARACARPACDCTAAGRGAAAVGAVADRSLTACAPRVGRAFGFAAGAACCAFPPRPPSRRIPFRCRRRRPARARDWCSPARTRGSSRPCAGC